MFRSMRLSKPIGILVIVALLASLASFLWTASPVLACDDDNLSKREKLLKRLHELERELGRLRVQAQRISDQEVTAQTQVAIGEGSAKMVNVDLLRIPPRQA